MIFFGIMLIVIAGLMIWHLKLRYHRVRAMNNDLGTSPGWDDFILVRYKGDLLPMRMFEKLMMWDCLDRTEKREAAMKIRQGVKKGKLSGNFKDQDLPIYED